MNYTNPHLVGSKPLSIGRSGRISQAGRKAFIFSVLKDIIECHRNLVRRSGQQVDNDFHRVEP